MSDYEDEDERAYGWFDDYLANKDFEESIYPNRLENFMSSWDADAIRKWEADDIEASREPPDSFVENGQWVKVITAEVYAQVAAFFKRMDEIPGTVHRLTIMEDRRCSLVHYPDWQKKDIIVLMCLAIAGTDDDTWYGIDYFGKEHYFQRHLLFP